MAGVEFGLGDSFDANLEKICVAAEGLDADLGAVLRSNIGLLAEADDDASRKDARTAFNEAVRAALDGAQNARE